MRQVVERLETSAARTELEGPPEAYLQRYLDRIEQRYDNQHELNFRIKVACNLRLSSRTTREGFVDRRLAAAKPRRNEPI